MFTLTKINVMWEKLLALTKKVDAIDVELPDHGAGDAGKYLGVDSSGDLEFSNPPGKYNFDYSETETTTGQKWIDNRELYCLVLTGTFPTIESSTTVELDHIATNLTLVNTILMAERTNGIQIDLSNYPIKYVNSTGAVYLTGVSTDYSEATYDLILYYAKPTPVPSNETKSTKKKTTKK